MKKILLIITFSTLNLIAYAQDEVVGKWKTQAGNAIVQIYKTTVGTYAGKIVWLQEPIDPETHLPKLDKRNPKQELRSHPLMNLVNIWGFKYDADDKNWTGGHVYDPKTGKEYSCKMSFDENKKLKVRGYIGISLIGKTDVWTRQ